MIRVVLPHHLRTLARVGDEVQLEPFHPRHARRDPRCARSQIPVLRGAIRDHVTKKRRPMVRFFACEEDVSHEPPDFVLPSAIANGTEPFFIIGAIAGG